MSARIKIEKSRRGARPVRSRAPAFCQILIRRKITIKFYTKKPTWYAYPDKDKQEKTRDKHATISVIKHREKDFCTVDGYLSDCEQRFQVTYLKRMNASAEQAWQSVMKSTNAQFYPRAKNTVLECLQFGGNSEFWSGFASEQDIARYFTVCYAYAVQTIGFLKTDENIVCAVIVTEPNHRNLFVYYLPITEKWTSKVIGKDKSERGNKLQQRDELDEPLYTLHTDIDAPRLSSTEFWKRCGGLTSFSDLQEDFFHKISSRYGAVRGEGKSYLKHKHRTGKLLRYDRRMRVMNDNPFALIFLIPLHRCSSQNIFP